MAYGNIASVGKITVESNYTISNATVLKDENNIVMLCGNITVTNATTGRQKLMTLPHSSMYPNETIRFLAPYLSSGGTGGYMAIIVETTGEIYYTANVGANSTIFLNGAIFHVNSKYYNDTIGNNNQSLFTRPMYVR